jgi:hypothetical protein
MANTFSERAVKFIPILDEIYVRESLTAFLEMNPLTVLFDGTATVKLPKIVVDGAADYNRSTGYTKGNIAVSYSSHTLAYDRARKFGVDILDDDEAAFNVFVQAATEYVRTKEIPETDAIRFAEMYAFADNGGTVVTADLAANQAIAAFDTAEQVLGDLDVSELNRIMWCSYTFYKLLKTDTAVARRIDAGDVAINGINRKVDLLDGQTPIIRVPQGRFYDVITLYDGVTGGQETGGYIPTPATSRPLNFIYADKGALNAVSKRRISKVIDWTVNPDADENLVMYRHHHDLIVPSNKEKGIYVHRKSTTV